MTMRRLAFIAPVGVLWLGGANGAHAQAIGSLPISSFCSPGVMQQVASSVNPTVTVGTIPDGPNLPSGVQYVAATASTPSYCAVTGSVVTNPATNKTANFFIELPSNWNGKFLFSGCGGNCGSVGRPPVTALQRGYAAATTDDGHIANATGAFDGTWAVSSPGVLNPDTTADFYYRAVHTVTVAGKQLATAFFSRVMGMPQTLAYSYFTGCSDGGREGMVEVTRYPQDFDGVIAGAPFFDIRGQNIAGLQVSLAQLRSSSAIVPPALLKIVDQVVLSQCDGLDGVQDGLIQNPGACHFNPQTDLPICTASSAANTCFTQDQINAVSSFISATTNESGTSIHPGYSLTNMNDAAGANLAVWTASPFTPPNPAGPEPWGDGKGPAAWLAGDGVFRYLAYADAPGYNSVTTPGIGFTTDPASAFVKQVEAALSGPLSQELARTGAPSLDRVSFFHSTIPQSTVNFVDSRTYTGDGNTPQDAVPFLSQGRKLLMYHGFSDGFITPYTTIQYYRALAGLAGGYGNLQNGAQLFMVPGMLHCGGGPGPNSFDTLTALENWVEGGQSPDVMIAAKYVNDTPAAGLSRTMPLCKFPSAAKYNGSGNVNSAENWSCDPNDDTLLHVGLNGLQAGEAAPLNPPQ